MGAVKELYMAMVEEKMGELCELGMDEQDAYELASKEADRGLSDRMADLADAARQRAKDSQHD